MLFDSRAGIFGILEMVSCGHLVLYGQHKMTTTNETVRTLHSVLIYSTNIILFILYMTVLHATYTWHFREWLLLDVVSMTEMSSSELSIPTSLSTESLWLVFVTHYVRIHHLDVVDDEI